MTNMNVRDVVRLDETPPGYLVTVDLPEVTGARYCARVGGGDTSDAIIAAIEAGEFEGEISDDTPSIETLRAEAQGTVLAWITTFTAQFVAGYASEEVASWPAKSAAARAHLAGDPQAIITNEAAITGEDPDDLAQIIVSKADQYQGAVARVTGLRRATRDAVNAATTKEAIDQIVADALRQAETLVADLGMQDGQETVDQDKVTEPAEPDPESTDDA